VRDRCGIGVDAGPIAAWIVLVLFAFAGGLRAQWPFPEDGVPEGSPLSPQGLQRLQDAQNVGPLQLDPRELLGGRLPPGYSRLSESFDLFSGFPNFTAAGMPSTTGGFGIPGVGGSGAGDLPFTPLIGRPAPRAPDAWPTWFVDGPGEEGDRFTARRGLLIRESDRVWLRESEESAFVPLRFSDKFRPVEVGDVVEIRQKGEARLLLQDGSSLKAFGPVRIELEELSEEVVALRMPRVTLADFLPLGRMLRVVLPDGTVFQAAKGSYRWRTRDDGLAVLANVGSEPATLVLAGPGDDAQRVRPLPPGSHVLLRTALYADPFDSGAPRPGGGTFVEGDAAAREDGQARVFEGRGEGATVFWSGARFDVPAGGTLRLDPLGEEVPVPAVQGLDAVREMLERVKAEGASSGLPFGIERRTP
jgi:hypothetical protein